MKRRTNRKQIKNTGRSCTELLWKLIQGAALALFTMLFLFTILFLLIFTPFGFVVTFILLAVVIAWLIMTFKVFKMDNERNGKL